MPPEDITPEDITSEERLLRHLDYCDRMAERMKRDGTWPWKETSDRQTRRI